MFSNKLPTTAPSILAPRAALGDIARRNCVANKRPGKETGTAKMAAATQPTNAADPGTREKGIAQAMTIPAITPPTINQAGQGLCCFSMIVLARLQCRATESRRALKKSVTKLATTRFPQLHSLGDASIEGMTSAAWFLLRKTRKPSPHRTTAEMKNPVERQFMYSLLKSIEST